MQALRNLAALMLAFGATALMVVAAYAAMPPWIEVVHQLPQAISATL